jgi:hypothetical protein
MEEPESPVEQLSEELHHAAEHAKEDWLKYGALLSALLAVLAAISGMQSGHEVNEAMIAQIKASDAWGYYQAKGIKIMIAESEPQTAATAARVKKHQKEQQKIKEDAEAKDLASEHHLQGHETLSRAVTLFQVAIAMTAIAVLARQRKFLLVSAGLGCIGVGFFVQYWMW